MIKQPTAATHLIDRLRRWGSIAVGSRTVAIREPLRRLSALGNRQASTSSAASVLRCDGSSAWIDLGRCPPAATL
jgi:hypothetical protein